MNAPAMNALAMNAAVADRTPSASHAPGTALFMGLPFPPQADVLAPRAETELLARTALAAIEARAGTVRVVDMCCGSGNVAIALAHHAPRARVAACDLTAGAVSAARANAERLGVADRVEVLRGDLFAPLAGRWLEGRVDLVVCNPPYISTGRLAGDRAHLVEREPREAFDGGPYGISILQRLAREAIPFLAPGGVLAFEFGHGQERQVTRLLERAAAYDDIRLVADETGAPRVARARRREGDAV
ncbi:HemK family protein methyltransferase [Salinarimonas sp.]|uniref:N5-glutamine methyltransferase family protein n=1 Tax=Salinarimonas sp. TaxID=2766526 RepID=UPI0032D93940